jgi:hypothetical protein
MPFRYTLYKSSDIHSEMGHALAEDAAEALAQIRDYRRKNGRPDLAFKISDTPSRYVLIESDPHGNERRIYVGVDAT